MNKRKIFLIILGIILIALIGLLVYKFVLNKDNSNPKISSVVDNIIDYGYTLDDRDTLLFKEEFENLKNVLSASDVDFEEYALSLSKLFIIDFYTLNNKINKYDVGSLEYLHETIVDNFKLKAKDTIYKYIEDDSDHKRKQELPEVSKITEINLESDKYEIDGTKVDSYEIKINWDYVKDLGYEKEGIITLIKVDKKLVVVDFQTEID